MSSLLTLDHVDRLTLDGSAVKRYGNELRSLEYLAQGLHYLNGQVHHIEQEIWQTLDPKQKHLIFGNHPALEDVPQGLVASAFHWYAASACNFVRLAGWLGLNEDPGQALAYVKSVIPAVKIWRDKVGAHFARAKPDKSDSPADLIASVMFPVAFDDNAFWTGSFTLGVTRAGHGSSSRSDMRWSLTDTHRKLTERYWPTSVTQEQKEREPANA